MQKCCATTLDPIYPLERFDSFLGAALILKFKVSVTSNDFKTVSLFEIDFRKELVNGSSIENLRLEEGQSNYQAAAYFLDCHFSNDESVLYISRHATSTRVIWVQSFASLTPLYTMTCSIDRKIEVLK